MTHSGTFRWIVTVLTAVCVPLCCCNLDFLSRACKSCEGQPVACHGDAQRSNDHQHADDDATGLDHHRDAPSPSKHEHDSKDTGCTCGGESKLGTLDAKSSVSLPPPVVLYLLPEWFDSKLLAVVSATWQADLHAPFKQAQTLLRQHCALTI